MNIPAGFEIESQTDDRIVLVKKTDKDWVPGEGEEFYYVDHAGVVMCTSFHSNFFLDFGNCFPTKEMAEKAVPLIRRSNHIIQKCLLVDPEFEPDWSNPSKNYYPYFYGRDQNWCGGFYSNFYKAAPAYVSNREKCEEVCALLTKWGVE